MPPLAPFPTGEADVIPVVPSGDGGTASSTRMSLVPTAGPGEPQNKGTVGEGGNGGLAFTQRLALGLGLARK